MTRRTNRAGTSKLRLLSAALLAFAPAMLAAQDGQFDLRTRSTPTPAPQPTVVGPVDPDAPSTRPRPAPAPTIVLPPSTAQPSPGPAAAAQSAAPPPGPERAQARPVARTVPAGPGDPQAATGGPAPAAPVDSAAPAGPAPPTTPLPRAYQPRDLDVVAEASPIGLWLGLGALVLLVLGSGWLAWSRHFRDRARPLPTPVVERPRMAPAAPPPPAGGPEPAPVAAAGGLHLALQATRMSATLVNTTLSYRLAVTNRGAQPLNDVRIAGDMIAAHASRPASEQLGPGEAALPELHRIATLAPGESVTLAGDIRLPLVSITPIRRGDAALFVPLARLRAHGQDPTGATIEGGGTFLVGQEPGASKRLQPFRLDLGPRNYSRLGQQLLPAA